METEWADGRFPTTIGPSLELGSLFVTVTATGTASFGSPVRLPTEGDGGTEGPKRKGTATTGNRKDRTLPTLSRTPPTCPEISSLVLG